MSQDLEPWDVGDTEGLPSAALKLQGVVNLVSYKAAHSVMRPLAIGKMFLVSEAPLSISLMLAESSGVVISGEVAGIGDSRRGCDTLRRQAVYRFAKVSK